MGAARRGEPARCLIRPPARRRPARLGSRTGPVSTSSPSTLSSVPVVEPELGRAAARRGDAAAARRSRPGAGRRRAAQQAEPLPGRDGDGAQAPSPGAPPTDAAAAEGARAADRRLPGLAGEERLAVAGAARSGPAAARPRRRPRRAGRRAARARRFRPAARVAACGASPALATLTNGRSPSQASVDGAVGARPCDGEPAASSGSSGRLGGARRSRWRCRPGSRRAASRPAPPPQRPGAIEPSPPATTSRSAPDWRPPPRRGPAGTVAHLARRLAQQPCDRGWLRRLRNRGWRERSRADQGQGCRRSRPAGRSNHRRWKQRRARPWCRASRTRPATTAARPRCATCSPSTASRSARRWPSGSAPGACFYYLTLEGTSPTRWFNGRTARPRGELRRADRGGAGAAHLRAGDEGAWEAARAEVDAGRPALLLTDLYHLDHYGNSAHFPGHAVVLAGYDEELAHLSDTAFEELQTTRLENLAAARHSDHPAYPLSGHMFTRRRGSTRRAAARGGAGGDRAGGGAMLEPRVPGFSGLRGAPARRRGRLLARGGRGLAVVRALRLPGDRAPRHRRRRLPADVLALPRRGGPARGGARRGGRRGWTALAEALRAASEATSPDPAIWRGSTLRPTASPRAEERLWVSLATP